MTRSCQPDRKDQDDDIDQHSTITPTPEDPLSARIPRSERSYSGREHGRSKERRHFSPTDDQSSPSTDPVVRDLRLQLHTPERGLETIRLYHTKIDRRLRRVESTLTALQRTVESELFDLESRLARLRVLQLPHRPFSWRRIDHEFEEIERKVNTLRAQEVEGMQATLSDLAQELEGRIERLQRSQAMHMMLGGLAGLTLLFAC